MRVLSAADAQSVTDEFFDMWGMGNWSPEVFESSPGELAVNAKIALPRIRDLNEPMKLAEFYSGVTKKILESRVIQGKMKPLHDEIAELKKEVERLAPYKTYYEGAYTLSHGRNADSADWIQV